MRANLYRTLSQEKAHKFGKSRSLLTSCFSLRASELRFESLILLLNSFLPCRFFCSKNWTKSLPSPMSPCLSVTGMGPICPDAPLCIHKLGVNLRRIPSVFSSFTRMCVSAQSALMYGIPPFALFFLENQSTDFKAQLIKSFFSSRKYKVCCWLVTHCVHPLNAILYSPAKETTTI